MIVATHSFCVYLLFNSNGLKQKQENIIAKNDCPGIKIKLPGSLFW
jgi:hypothetical protein